MGCKRPSKLGGLVERKFECREGFSRFKGCSRCTWRRLRAQLMRGRVQMVGCKLRAGERPSLRGPLLGCHCGRIPDEHGDRRRRFPTVVGTFEKMVEELALQRQAFLAVEAVVVRPVVQEQPLLGRRRLNEAFVVAASVKARGCEVSGGQQRDHNATEIRAHLPLKGIEQGMLMQHLDEVAPVRVEHGLVDGRAGWGGMGPRITVGSGSIAILVWKYLALEPQLQELIAFDTAMKERLAIEIRSPLPRGNRSKMRRPKGRDLPLVDGHVRNAQKPNP